MTTNESFKRRIRTRMAKTGERYSAARQAMLEAAASNGPRRRTWASEPEMRDEAVREATGRGWEEWCDLLDAWPDNDGNHTAIATYLRDELGVDAWWSQAVTGGYERITGLRLPGQMPDGTFTANKSKTIAIDAGWLHAALLDDERRQDLFPGLTTTLRSKPSAKSLRVQVGPGVAGFGFGELDDGRTKVTVQHAKLPAFEDIEEWKFYWGDWLDALDGALTAR